LIGARKRARRVDAKVKQCGAKRRREGAIDEGGRGTAGAEQQDGRRMTPTNEREERKRRRRAAWRASPLPDGLFGKFTEGEGAIITVIVDTIRRAGGPCALCRAAIAKQAGTGASTYARALRKAHNLGLLATELHGKNRLIRLAESTSPRPTPNP
jgi:hypothetical protein